MAPLRVCGLVTVVRPYLTNLRALRRSLVLCEVRIETEPWLSFNVALPAIRGGLFKGIRCGFDLLLSQSEPVLARLTPLLLYGVWRRLNILRFDGRRRSC